MTYAEDLRRLHEARIDALERRVEQLETYISVLSEENIQLILNQLKCN